MEQEEPTRLRKYSAVRPNGSPVTVEDWALAVAESNAKEPNAAILGLASIFRTIPYNGLFFETPPVTKASAKSQKFEFVLVDSAELASIESPDPVPFQDHFQSSDKASVSFRNLSGQSVLIAPTPSSSTTISTHLVTFMRTASTTEMEALWNLAANQYLNEMSGEKLWFSTSGLGVYWLHFRLDSYPKYYTHKPYKNA